MVITLHQLGSPCYSGVAVGGVDKCQDAGYQGAGDSEGQDRTWGCMPETPIVVGYIFPPGPSVV